MKRHQEVPLTRQHLPHHHVTQHSQLLQSLSTDVPTPRPTRQVVTLGCDHKKPIKLEQEKKLSTLSPATCNTRTATMESADCDELKAAENEEEMAEEIKVSSLKVKEDVEQMEEKTEVDKFKDVFKYYKRRKPPPDLSRTIDLDSLTQVKVVPPPLQVSSEDRSAARMSGLIPPHTWTIHSLVRHPGMLVVRNPFTRSGQLMWARVCLCDLPCAANKTNLSSHGIHLSDSRTWWQLCQTSDGRRNGLRHKLRWVTLGYHHNWDTKKYSEDNHSEMPESLAVLCGVVASVLGLGAFQAQAAIMNFYPAHTTLSPHTDHSEPYATAPLLSFSFGQSAVFLIGGTSKATEPSAILLHSGDIVVMSSASRLCYHAVPRILARDERRRRRQGADRIEEEVEEEEDEPWMTDLLKHRNENQSKNTEDERKKEEESDQKKDVKRKEEEAIGRREGEDETSQKKGEKKKEEGEIVKRVEESGLTSGSGEEIKASESRIEGMDKTKKDDETGELIKRRKMEGKETQIKKWETENFDKDDNNELYDKESGDGEHNKKEDEMEELIKKKKMEGSDTKLRIEEKENSDKDDNNGKNTDKESGNGEQNNVNSDKNNSGKNEHHNISADDDNCDIDGDDLADILQYLRTCRINMNVRQVLPPSLTSLPS